MSETKSSQPTFLFVYRDAADMAELSPEEMQKVFDQWMAWRESMRARGQYLGGARLNDAGKVVRQATGAFSDGPFVEAKEVVGGYMLIAADNLEAAANIARGCPGFKYGGSMEVRPVETLRTATS